MSDDAKDPETKPAPYDGTPKDKADTAKPDKSKGNVGMWIGAGIGAGIGSAAIAAALLYATRSNKKPKSRAKD